MKRKEITVRGFTQDHQNLVTTLISQVGICEAFDPRSSLPHPTVKLFNGIWDTGATNTAITKKVVEKCNLQPITKVIVNTASGECKSNVYLINIMLPNRVAIPNVRVSQCELPTSRDVDILIGMDIIVRGDFAITNFNGNNTLSFRIPSIERIDFETYRPNILKARKSDVPKVGRNDPCPCGSGKKYKHCCGNKR